MRLIINPSPLLYKSQKILFYFLRINILHAVSPAQITFRRPQNFLIHQLQIHILPKYRKVYPFKNMFFPPSVFNWENSGLNTFSDFFLLLIIGV